MINFGTTCVLLEIYKDKDEKKIAHSTRTRTKRSRDDSLNRKDLMKKKFLSPKKPIERSLRTCGDKPKQICLYVTVYSRDVYIRKM